MWFNSYIAVLPMAYGLTKFVYFVFFDVVIYNSCSSKCVRVETHTTYQLHFYRSLQAGVTNGKHGRLIQLHQ